jgi:hypothetical protein
MRRTIAVHLGAEARPLGVLRYDQQGARESAAFEYAAAWIKAASRFATEPGLPLVAGPLPRGVPEMAAIPLLGIPGFLRLRPEDGAKVSQHRRSGEG